MERLAARVGATPFFAYDRGLLTDRVAAVRRALPDGIHLSYAVKANPMPALLHHMSTLVDGFDVASGLELRAALDTPVRPAKVSFAGPGKTVGRDSPSGGRRGHRRAGIRARTHPGPGGCRRDSASRRASRSG